MLQKTDQPVEKHQVISPIYLLRSNLERNKQSDCEIWLIHEGLFQQAADDFETHETASFEMAHKGSIHPETVLRFLL
jgi:hypothetical protein